ncbi:MAG: hypothetical protein ACJ790_08500 [Myxococcaceae bacterium]
MRVLVCALILVATAAFAETKNPYLPAAQRLFDGLEYEEAGSTLKKARDWQGNTPEDEVAIAMLEGRLSFETGDRELAGRSFKRALALDPNAQLPKLVSAKAKAFFDQCRVELGLAKTAEVPPTEIASSSPGGSSFAPWVVTGAGAAAALGGVALTLSARSFLSRDLSGFTYTEAQSQQKAEESKLLIGQALIGAGVLAAAGGVVWYFVRRDDAPSVSAIVLPAGAVVSLSARF